MVGPRMAAAMLAVLWAALSTADGQVERPDTRSRDEAALWLPSPAQLAIWAERPGYLRFRDLIRVHFAAHPNGDRRNFSEFVFLERIGTGNRRYLGGSGSHRWLRDEIVDSAGLRSWAWGSARIEPRAVSSLWSGRIVDPGLWQIVVELRSPDTTEVIKRAHAKFVVSGRLPQLVGTPGRDSEIATDTTWENHTIHALRSRVFVKAGATLTIEPGTLVLAKGPQAGIVVEPGGRIVAAGRPEAPIVMTCDDAVGQRSAGCWGGLVILGRAPVAAGPEAAGLAPAARAAFGGEDALDGSRVLRYVRVEFAGAVSADAAERGGIGFHGVGSGTVIDHVQSHASASDGIRFVGGTANCKHCVSSGAADDGLDWSRGWQGSAQFLFLLHGPGAGDCAIEGRDSNVGPGGLPLGGPRLYNVTAVGNETAGASSDPPACGLRLHRGGAATARNIILTGFSAGSIVQQGNSASALGNRLSSLSHAILQAHPSWDEDSRVPGGTDGQTVHLDADPKLVNIQFYGNPDPRPKLESLARTIGAGATPPSDGFLDTSAQWIGAFHDSNWLEEWTYFEPEPESGTESAAGESN